MRGRWQGWPLVKGRDISTRASFWKHAILILMLLTVKYKTCVLPLFQITFSQPKQCYVPAVFPTQPQPYPDQDYSVPSSAHCPVLATTMERSLTRTSSRQGCLSGMCDSQWNIAARENKCGVEIYGSLRNDAGPLKVNKVLSTFENVS